MTVRRGLTLAAVAALVAAAAAVLVTLGRAGLASGGTPAPAALPIVTRATSPLSPPASVPTPISAPVSTPVSTPISPVGASPGAETADVVPAASPAPFVQHFADGPTASPLPRQQSPTTPLKISAFVDGCDHNYGTRTQCVPLVFPDGITGVAGKCAWLAAHGFTHLMVAGKDTQGLDADGDRTACD
ncbi:hypothetical protein [Actinoplanes subtropicus]|uniref:hypothetical protein n=1 Tax=Actinoplanes subtropicus TaxID=543632 RepID=UPI00054E4204|nr:hypothetical protein [Actinoplanes subtropicus]